MLIRFAALAFAVTLSVVGCATQTPPPAPSPTPVAQTSKSAQLKVISAAFKEGESIPRQYTCQGVNISPPLEWSGVPKAAKSIAIIADDPDAPSGTFTHWVLYNLPADKIGLIENTPPAETLPGGGMQGENDFHKTGYGGPCPPSGTHRYFFKIYALDSELSLKAGASKTDVEQAMQGHIIAQGQLMGRYQK